MLERRWYIALKIDRSICTRGWTMMICGCYYWLLRQVFVVSIGGDEEARNIYEDDDRTESFFFLSLAGLDKHSTVWIK